MKQLIIISTIIGLSAAVCSCDKNNEKAEQNTYKWGFAITGDESSQPLDNILYEEAINGILELEKKYNGEGSHSSDAEALEKAKYEEALIAYNALEATVNEHINTVDNHGRSFKISSKYYITKNDSPLKDEVSKTFEMKKDKCIRFSEYDSITVIPLTDELQKKDPASYPVTINLEATGMILDDMSDLKYDSVKVYVPSTREINTELTFISEGSASLAQKTLTLTFTGTSSTLASMKGEWYANAYITITSPLLESSSTPGIVKVPFTVK